MNSSSDAAKADTPIVRPVSVAAVASAWVLPEFAAEAAPSLVADSEPKFDPAEAERLRATAHAEGFAAGQAAGRVAGFAEGHAAGLAAAAEETARLQQRLRGWLSALAAPLAALDDEVSTQLGQLAMQVARALIYRELRAQPEDLAAVARDAIAALPGAVREVVLVCHPEDAAALQAVLGGDRWSVQGDATVTIQPDASLTPGGLRVESRTPGLPSRIDATLQARWAALSLRVLNEIVAGPADPLPDDSLPDEQWQAKKSSPEKSSEEPGS
ncbi:FliH/SctL family protein [Halothiobacillus sp. DCM-1]|uniref:FliH/SctL family protein n=1 Tax=Halothiobacillus sp. DCM-1 TaxID=3112558 RepID=UPI0032440EFC